MFGAGERMVEKACFFLGEDEDPAGAVGELLKRSASLTPLRVSHARGLRRQSSMA